MREVGNLAGISFSTPQHHLVDGCLGEIAKRAVTTIAWHAGEYQYVQHCQRQNVDCALEPVDNIQQGKVTAEAYAKAYLKNAVNLELPSLEWKSSRSIW
jgi:hypothetical protein